MHGTNRIGCLLLLTAAACAAPEASPVDAPPDAAPAPEPAPEKIAADAKGSAANDAGTSADVEKSTVAEQAGESSAAETEPPAKRPDVVFVPTPQPVVERMLKMAKVSKNDLLYDLGSGDGRIVVTAAKLYGARGKGFDVDPDRIAEARANAKKAGVEHLVSFEQKDIFTIDLSPADVVTLYLLPELNVRLIPQLEQLKPGARIVSHDFDMQGVKPVSHVELSPPDADKTHEVYLWIAPIRRDRS
jgi:SAM-dependent methyltransferase